MMFQGTDDWIVMMFQIPKGLWLLIWYYTRGVCHNMWENYPLGRNLCSPTAFLQVWIALQPKHNPWLVKGHIDRKQLLSTWINKSRSIIWLHCMRHSCSVFPQQTFMLGHWYTIHASMSPNSHRFSLWHRECADQSWPPSVCLWKNGSRDRHTQSCKWVKKVYRGSVW